MAPKSKSLFRSIILPSFLVVFMTPFPKRFGLYEYLFVKDPFMVGTIPCLIPTVDHWGFTFAELYGSSGSDDSTSTSASIASDSKDYRNRLWGQTAIVTGANSGLGYEISLALARLGVSVTMACRDLTKCEAAAAKIRADKMVVQRGKGDRDLEDPGKNIATMQVDISSLKSVSAFCDSYHFRHFDTEGNPLPLDMLFLNAGMTPRNPKEDGSVFLTPDGIEITFATNVVGHHLMYKLLEPSLRHSPARKTPARIVLTTSATSMKVASKHLVPTDLATLNANPDPEMVKKKESYNQSKLAQILWAKELTAQLDSSSSDKSDPNSIVYVNSAHPGVVDTNLWQTSESAVVRTIFGALGPILWTPEAGALTLLYLGTAVERLRSQDVRGKYFHPQSKLMDDHKLAPDNDPATKVLQGKLWKFLDELVAEYL